MKSYRLRFESPGSAGHGQWFCGLGVAEALEEHADFLRSALAGRGVTVSVESDEEEVLS